MIAGILLVSCSRHPPPSRANAFEGGAICGAFVVFGGLSVFLYKPWRRRVDKKRLGNAHFEPLSQNPDTVAPHDEEQQNDPSRGTKDVDVVVQSVEATDLAGPAHR